MGKIKQTTNEKVIEAFRLFKKDSTFEFVVYQPTNANNHIQLRWRDDKVPVSIHYEFLFEKNHGGYSIELHVEKSKIQREICGELAKINFDHRTINEHDLVFYFRHRDDYGPALKVSYGSDVPPEIMAEDMHLLIEKTRKYIENMIERIRLA